MTESLALKSPIGLLEICGRDGAIVRLCLKRGETEAERKYNCTPRCGLLYEAYNQLNEYFSGKRTEFNLPINPSGTLFQRQVWNELRKIPYGKTRSYEEIAAGIGKPNAARAVGQANNKNPLLIIVPCHRVIHKNGSIEGFACGTGAKKYLLNLEKAHADSL